MNKKKTIAYMMAATLLVGGTFVGTKALFTDKIDDIAELAISTGDVDIEVTDKGEWILSRNGEDLKDGSTIKDDALGRDGKVDIMPDHNEEDKLPQGVKPETPFANNLKIGDKLTKTVTIKNTGTLTAKLNLEQIKENGNIPDSLKGIISLKGNYIVQDNDTSDSPDIIEAGETAIVNLEIELKDNGQEQLHNSPDKNSANGDKTEDTVLNLSNRWKLSAEQLVKSDFIRPEK